ncbi:MAG: formylglycine-generating enzyme family protein [Magnetococcales bacterium]|nr:formylglycine-generating enzyme family protein [Magnetococcales bacterium]MBF0151760.1 formylglycine-generating enzyme family protein [Magnetococcales bacterium]
MDTLGEEVLMVRRVDSRGGVTDEPLRFEIFEDYVNGLNMRFKLIPEGRFFMGSPEGEYGRDSDESLHEVALTRPFYLQDTPVTQGQWEAVMGENPSHFKGGGSECPVESVSWEDCQEFIRRLNAREGGHHYRLPTEAEWEYACRAGSDTAVYNGPLIIIGKSNAPGLDEIAWYSGNSGVDYPGGVESDWPEMQYPASHSGTHPVRQKVPNAWGLYDMLGNVWEWCQDWYDGKYYANSPCVDPQGPPMGSRRVYRGGSWYNSPANVRSAHRSSNDPGDRHNNLGFRLARTCP